MRAARGELRRVEIQLYLLRAADAEAVRRCVAGGEVREDAEGFQARWGDFSVRLQRLRSEAADELRRRLSSSGCPAELTGRLGAAREILAVAPGPGHDLSGRPERLIRELTRELEGLVSGEDFVLDGEGRLLFGAPPTPVAVARRALALAAVVHRGYIEGFAPAAFQDAHHDALAWIRQQRLEAALEGYELRLVRTAQGVPQRQEIINATWRAEGLIVLAWALRILEHLPPPDVAVHPKAVTESLGFLATELPPASTEPRLREPDELERERRRLRAIYRRLRGLSGPPGTAESRQLQLPTTGGDLALGGTPLARAPAEQVARCLSIGQERYQAIQWLLGSHPLYSVVDLSR